jgi:hypothetical protein
MTFWMPLHGHYFTSNLQHFLNYLKYKIYDLVFCQFSFLNLDAISRTFDVQFASIFTKICCDVMTIRMQFHELYMSDLHPNYSQK